MLRCDGSFLAVGPHHHTAGDTGRMSANRAPAGLGPQGRKFWKDVSSVYELAPGEIAILTRACRALDRLASIDAELAGAELMVEGSQGQARANPLLAAADSTERVLDVLVRALALPLPDEPAGRRRSPSAVAAARQRWRGQVGV